jgi:hypothetical protein
MKQVSFDDIGQVLATFKDGGVTAGAVVKVTDSGTVGPCGAGERFCGVALTGRGGFVAVQVSGFAAVKTDGAVTPGWVKLTADGSGGVKTAGSSDAGADYLVAETDGNTAVLYL